MGDNEIAQILNYLKGSEKRVGYLINYGCPISEDEWLLSGEQLRFFVKKT
ncbi:MAG: hypothetical protein JXB88_10300 [Spirochaetales bacterium]|nr:hypothetical protein [Spirochaetales bacterium]